MARLPLILVLPKTLINVFKTLLNVVRIGATFFENNFFTSAVLPICFFKNISEISKTLINVLWHLP